MAGKKNDEQHFDALKALHFVPATPVKKLTLIKVFEAYLDRRRGPGADKCWPT
jgi:hypothetical protein